MVRRKNPHAAALSKLGASKGGEARAKAMTAAQRRESARKAALARWVSVRMVSPSIECADTGLSPLC